MVSSKNVNDVLPLRGHHRLALFYTVIEFHINEFNPPVSAKLFRVKRSLVSAHDVADLVLADPEFSRNGLLREVVHQCPAEDERVLASIVSVWTHGHDRLSSSGESSIGSALQNGGRSFRTDSQSCSRMGPRGVWLHRNLAVG